MESYLSTLNPQDRLSLLSLLSPKDDASEVSESSRDERDEDLQEENKSLKRQLAYYKQQWTEMKAHKERTETAMESLRSLVAHYMGSESKLLQKSAAEKQFWSKVQVNDLLDKSEPPPDFPLPPNELPSTKATVQKLTAALAQTTKELTSLMSRHEKLQLNYDSLSATHTQLKIEGDKQQEACKKQLKGAVRRVQYLVEEKSRLEDELKRQGAYVTKLELRLVQDEARLKEVKNKKALASRLQEPLGLVYKFDD
jgi:DNA repair exonuclease SbcCD ATPase subunit